MKKSYTVPLTGEVRIADKIGNPNDDGKIVFPVTGWNNGSGQITNDLSEDDPNVTFGVVSGETRADPAEAIIISITSMDWGNSRCVVEIDMPARFEARFDTFLNGKTDAQILSDASKPALVKI